MEDFDTIGRINQLLLERNWSLYQLSKVTGIPKSTLNRLIKYTNSPTVRTVGVICRGFGITLEEFFQLKTEKNSSNNEQQQFVDAWNKLVGNDKEKALAYMEGLTADYQ